MEISILQDVLICFRMFHDCLLTLSYNMPIFIYTIFLPRSIKHLSPRMLMFCVHLVGNQWNVFEKRRFRVASMGGGKAAKPKRLF